MAQVNCTAVINSDGTYSVTISDLSVAWSFDYNLLCDGVVAGTASVSGGPILGVPNDNVIPESHTPTIMGTSTTNDVACSEGTTTYSLVGGSEVNGTVVLNSNGSFVFTPAANGAWEFEYEMTCTVNGVSQVYGSAITSGVHTPAVLRITSGAGATISAPIVVPAGGSINIDWKDGSGIQTYNTSGVNPTHTYAAAGTYDIECYSGDAIEYSWTVGGAARQTFNGIVAWGGIDATKASFHGSSFVNIMDPNPPSSMTDMSYFLAEAPSNPDMSLFDMSNVVDVSFMYYRNGAANPDTTNWDTSSIEDAKFMFTNATSANPNTTNWDVSSVTDMKGMFEGATSANPDVSLWNVSNVTDAGFMFRNATSADPDTKLWNTSSLVLMNNMFEGATSSDAEVNAWNISNVTSMSSAFVNNAWTAATYGQALDNFASQTVQAGVILDVTSTYTIATSQAHRDILTNAPNNWIITDGGGV